MKNLTSSLSLALTTIISSTVIQANENPFSAELMPSAYMVTADNKAVEGKCGGSINKATEAKCGNTEKSATKEDDHSDTDKAKEGKCGEAKCGGSM